MAMLTKTDTQVSYQVWPKQGLPHPSAITSLIERLTNILRRCDSKQIVVMCRLESINIKYSELVIVICVYLYNSDGIVRSGTFVCVHSQLERLKTEGVVDVFQTIKSARIHRPGIIPNTVGHSIYNFLFSTTQYTLTVFLLLSKDHYVF